MGSDEQSLEFWLQDLERRQALAKPEHIMRGFFFKGMLKRVRISSGDETLERRCLEACGQEHFVDFFSYSVQLLFSILFTALPTLTERHGGAEAALRQLGQQSSLDFLESVTGKAMMLLAQGRPRLLLSSMPTAFRVAMSHGGGKVEWLEPTRGRLTAECSFVPPPFHEGLVQQMLEAGQAQDLHVSARSTGALDVVCDFSWK
ncbi:TIGR02265 family protein [Archangium sp.]|jgi:uncharacterized protein (TIGR02265 family)|uniref:TIGR02265 family protein n=1 Tax=Archangium sp. TaxID=1872627 RepID=UPI002ED86FD4